MEPEVNKAPAAVSPVYDTPPKVEEKEEEDYRFEVLYNDKAQLIKINCPSNMNAMQTLQHLEVAVNWLKGQVRKGLA